MIALIIASCLIEYGMDRMKLPGLLFGVLLITGYVFYNANKILKIAERHLSIMIILTIVVSALTITLLYMGWYELHRTTSYILMNICGMSWFLALLGIGMRIGSAKVLSILSTFSYEIYLTHHSFCTGPWNVYHLTDSPIVGLILIVCATAIVTVPLHFIGGKINGIIIKQ